MFTAPTKNKNFFGVGSIISEPMVEAWPEPMPGRKEQRGAAIRAAKDVLKKSFLESLISFRGIIFCFGIFVSCWTEIIKFERPNKPVSRGINGCLTGRLNVKIPRSPARRKIRRERRKFSSLRIKYKEAKIKM